MKEKLLCLFCDAEKFPEGPCSSCGQPGLLSERYQPVRVLGAGGMGRVYEARDLEAGGTRVAIKLVTLGDEWKAHELFESSSRVLQGLSHPGLPEVKALESAVDGRLFMVRPVYDGGTLESRIQDEHRRMSGDEIKGLLRSILEILEYLHSRNPPVIHRDIKPANIMFRTPSDNAPVLVDFDTIAQPEAQRSGITVVGTPGFVAPEQLMGQALPASDLFGVGTTLLFAATHTHPDDIPREAGRFKLDGLLDNLDASTQRVLTRLIEPDLSKRYQSTDDALRDLEKNSPAPIKNLNGTARSWRSHIIGSVIFVGMMLPILIITSIVAGWWFVPDLKIKEVHVFREEGKSWLTVSIEVEALDEMPFMVHSPTVRTKCWSGGSVIHDEDHDFVFHMDIAKLLEGRTARDRLSMNISKKVEKKLDACEISVQFGDEVELKGNDRFCYRDGAVTDGSCK